MKSLIIVNVLMHVFLTQTLIHHSSAADETLCEAVYNKNNNAPSGVYTIQPRGGPNGQQFQVFCDFSTPGTQWTIIQYRSGPELDFNRNWTEYENGFGDLNGDHWLGNSRIFEMTDSMTYYVLRVEITTWSGATCYAQYKYFGIGSAAENYKLNLGTYTGGFIECGDFMRYEDGMMFSTYDRDNDLCSTGSCAVDCHGGYWYKDCFGLNLNGRYFNGTQADDPYPLTVLPEDETVYSTHAFTWRDMCFLQKSVMKIRMMKNEEF